MQIWVIDTSSVILIKDMIPRAVRKHVTAELDKKVDNNSLVYPPQVLGELDRIANSKTKKTNPDAPLAWAKKNETKAARYGHLYDQARAVLKKVPNLIDPEKVSVGGVDEADPYVVALADQLRNQGHQVTIITDDVLTKPRKTSLADAAGLYQIPTVSMRTFLVSEGIWDGQEGS